MGLRQVRGGNLLSGGLGWLQCGDFVNVIDNIDGSHKNIVITKINYSISRDGGFAETLTSERLSHGMVSSFGGGLFGGDGGLDEAPEDDEIYGRKNAAWEKIIIPERDDVIPFYAAYEERNPTQEEWNETPFETVSFRYNFFPVVTSANDPRGWREISNFWYKPRRVNWSRQTLPSNINLNAITNIQNGSVAFAAKLIPAGVSSGRVLISPTGISGFTPTIVSQAIGGVGVEWQNIKENPETGTLIMVGGSPTSPAQMFGGTFAGVAERVGTSWTISLIQQFTFPFVPEYTIAIGKFAHFFPMGGNLIAFSEWTFTTSGFIVQGYLPFERINGVWYSPLNSPTSFSSRERWFPFIGDMIMAKTGEIITAAGQVNIMDGNTYYGGYLSWEWKIKEDVIRIFNGGIIPTNRPTGGNSIMQDDKGVVYICGRNSTVIRQEYNGGEFSSNWEVFQVGEPGMAWGGIIQLRNGLYFMTGNRN